MSEQKNYGSGNTNSTNSNNQFNVIININGKEEKVDVLYVLKAITRVFEEEDKRINEDLPNKVLINKTNHKESYQTIKIISSLLQLGIPLVASCEIAEATINKIKEFIFCNADATIELTTKDIRYMVSKSIQEMNLDRFTYCDIEKWNNRYIRRYGHNNQRIKVYYNDSEKSDEISYEFINSKLAKEIVAETTKGKIEYEKIQSKYKRDIADEILSFVNSCDLYCINYNILKGIIKEIALQPPHPWFIEPTTRRSIMNYDRTCLDNNINKINNALKDNIVSPQSAKIEVIHHASSLILEKYDYFLGCYDLSSFYLLRNMIIDIINPQNWDLAVNYSKASELLSDFSFSGIEIMPFVELTNRINHYLNEQNINNYDFDQLLLNFAQQVIKIHELGREKEVFQFLSNRWDSYSSAQAIEYLKILLYTIYPVKKWNLESTTCFFWISYKYVRYETSVDIKRQLFVVFNHNGIDDYSFLCHLEKATTKSICNVVLSIAEDENTAKETFEAVLNELSARGLDRDYLPCWLDKRHAQELFYSKNKMKYLGDLIQEQIDELCS